MPASFGKLAIVLLTLTLLCQACLALEIEGQGILQSVKAEVVIEGSGEISGNLQGVDVEIEILSFKENQNQKVLSLEESLEINGKNVLAEEKEDEFGNRYALFKVGETGSFSYRIEAVVETGMTLPDLQEYDLETEIGDFPEFLEASENIESNDEAIRTLAMNRFGKSSWIETLAETTQWTYESIDYDLSYFPETWKATEVLKEKKGVCDEFSVLSASILRARGIPTRVVTGITYNPKEGQGWNNHAWLESWNPGFGWVSSDPTFGEAGIVGGTHIARGLFKDPKNATITRARAVKGTNVRVEERLPKVEIVSTREFSGIFSLFGEDAVLPANEWHTLIVEAENKLDKTVIGIFTLVLPSDFTPQSKKTMQVFEPGEKRALIWDMMVDRELEKNQQLTGKYKVYAIGSEIEKKLKVMPGESFSEEAKIRLVDLIPIVEENTLVFEATVENVGAKKAMVEISANGLSEEFEVKGYEQAAARLEIPALEGNAYTVTVKGPGLDHSSSITVHEGTAMPVSGDDDIFGDDLPTIEELFHSATGNFFSIEAGLIAGLLIGVAVIVLLLKELLSR